jgi:hypothetical protein
MKLLHPIWMLIFVPLLLVAGRQAQAAWIECPGCTASSAENVAEQVIAPATQIVFDAGANQAWKFDVIREQVGKNCQINVVVGDKKHSNDKQFGQCQWANVAYPAALDVSDTETMTMLHEAYVATGGTWKGAMELNRNDLVIMSCGSCLEPSGSGYDVVNSMMFRSQVRDAVHFYANSLNNVLHSLAGLIGQAIEIHLAGANMDLTFIVIFPDGTRVPVVLDNQSPMGFIDTDRITDENGNELMTAANRDLFSGWGTVYQSNQAVDNFLRNAERLGVPISREGSGRSVSCQWQCENDHGAVVCRLHCSAN